MSNLYRYMDAVGDGTGNDNFNADYSAAEGLAIVAPPVDEVFNINRIIISLEDTTGMSASDYGNITGGLANGIAIKKDDGTNVINEITDGISVKSNAEWGMLCYDVDIKKWSTGNELLLARFTFTKGGESIELYGSNDHRLVISFNDDLTGLVSHRFMAQGTRRKI